MKISISILFLALIINTADGYSQGLLKINKRCIFLNGVNIPWHYFGADIGSHPQWGNLYDSTWFDSCFNEVKKYGVNCIRFWLHCDGRASPEFDELGYVTGLDSNFFVNLDDFFGRARKYDLMVVLCLWSYDMLKDRRDEAGRFAGGHNQLIANSDYTESYIKNSLVPIVNRYKDEPSLLAYEIINEPEWCIDVNNPTLCSYPVSLTDMQRFVGKCAAAIHRNCEKLVTLGSASLKWNSFNAGAMANYWIDEALIKSASDSLAYLDFYSIHYYDWMYDKGYNPFDSNPIFWNLNKPTIVGELPSKIGIYNVEEMMRQGFSNGWAGFFTWSYPGMDGAGNWDNSKNAHLNFYSAFYELINGKSCDSLFNITETDDITIFPNPSNSLLRLKIGGKNIKSIQLKIYNTIGKIQKCENINLSDYGNVFDIDVTSLNRGIYHLVINSSQNIFRKNFMRD